MKNKNGVEDETLHGLPTISCTNEENKATIIEFHSPTIAIKEDIGKFPVTIFRHGNLKTKATVR